MIRFLRDLVLRDFWLKLFSLALAVLIWVTVHITQGLTLSPVRLAPTETKMFPNLPVSVMSSAEVVRNLQVNPKEVKLVVQGDAKIIRRLQEKEIRAFVDLTGLEGGHSLRRRVEISTPAGVTHVKVEPEDVQVVVPPQS